MVQLEAVVGLIDPLESRRLKIVLATIFINVTAVGLLVFAPWSDWKTGLALNLFDNLLLIAFVILCNDRFLARLMLFGLVVGLAELPADAWLVDHTGTLDYSVGGGPMLWRSPVWMPLAWQIVTVQFGYLGFRLREGLGIAGLVVIGVLGVVNIPYYEEMAKRIHWWRYSRCCMVSNTPYYIILGEFGIAIAIALLAKPLRTRTWPAALGAGVAGGAAIFLAYAAAYGITDGIKR